MSRKSLAANILALCLITLARAADPSATPVEPADLTRRADLIGRSIVVDDRISRFQWHKGADYDEVFLKRTPVRFRLPARLRFEQAPRALAARIEGVLKREGSEWVCDVEELDLYPSDLERLTRATEGLSPVDAERRVGWARWAEQRGKAFEDQALIDRARTLEGEAIRIEAEGRSDDPPRLWLSLARRGRARQVPEPEPSALAHRAFAARLAAARGIDDLQALVNEIDEFWPESPLPPSDPADLAAWLAPYEKEPAAAYRAAPGPVRAALDHRLWADATQRLIERRMAAEPVRALELSREAAATLKDRPQVVARLVEQGLKEATRDLGALRRADVEALAATYRDVLNRPEQARDLLRKWLDDQRLHRLSATDAEGRVLLADQYESLLDDRATAVDLLRDAWRIDRQSREIADAFRRRGYHKVNDQWVEAAHAQGGPDDSNGSDSEAAPPPSTLPTSSLRGLTPAQVRARLGGKPDRVVWSASQGQLIEQWIYRGVQQDQYLNFLHTSGDPLPKVVAYYTRPHSRFQPRPDR